MVNRGKTLAGAFAPPGGVPRGAGHGFRASGPGAKVRSVLEHTEAFVDRSRLWLRKRLGRVRPHVIIPFRGFGTEQTLYLRGRVLEERGYHRRPSPESIAGQLRFMYQRFQSDEVPHARVVASYAGTRVEATADEEGFFEAVLEPHEPLPADRTWHEVDLALQRDQYDAPRATARVVVPPMEAEFAVISDIDDTIIKTSATSLWKMVRTTLLSTPESRLPFQGVAAFYLALQRGGTGSSNNPLFYVSSSPWNLHDVLTKFMDVHGIPAGPLFLRDFGFTRDYFFAAGHRRHKRAQIERLLRIYPNLPFILIGDSGQRDPEIYAHVVRDHPGRIRAVYIRDVGIEIGQVRTREFAAQAAHCGVPMVLVADTEGAALHAVEHGYIEAGTLPDIRAEKAKDEEAASDLTQMLRAAQ